MGKIWKVLLLALVANGLLATATLARPVFLTNGEILDAQSVWREEDTIFVLLNRDSLITFSADQLDLKKTFAKKWRNPPSKPATQEDKWAVVAKTVAAAAKVETPVAKPAETVAPVVPATPPVAAAQANPATPTTPQTATPPAAVSTTAPAPAASPKDAPTAAVSTPAPAPAPQPAPAATAKPRPAPRPTPEPGVVIPQFATGAATTGVLIALAALAAFLLLLLVSFWKVFTKAGQAGWKSLIPIYNVIVMLEIADCPLWWFLMFMIPVINLFFIVVMYIKLAERFGKGVLFGFGLCLFGFIFFPILAFDDSVYG